MPWIEPEPEPCTHPKRPDPFASDHGKTWECPTCGGRWRVEVQDMGHDVMPGERPYQINWRQTREPGASPLSPTAHSLGESS